MRQGTKPFEGTGGHGWQRGATLHPTENRAALAAWVITLWPRAEVRAESAVRRPVFDTVITNNDEFKSILKRAELPWPLCTAWHHPKSPVCSYWGQSTSRSSRCWLFAYRVGESTCRRTARANRPRTTIGRRFGARCPSCQHPISGGQCVARRPLLKRCAAVGSRSKMSASSTTSRLMNFWRGSVTSTGMAFTGCGSLDTRSIAIPNARRA